MNQYRGLHRYAICNFGEKNYMAGQLGMEMKAIELYVIFCGKYYGRKEQGHFSHFRHRHNYFLEVQGK